MEFNPIEFAAEQSFVDNYDSKSYFGQEEFKKVFIKGFAEGVMFHMNSTSPIHQKIREIADRLIDHIEGGNE